MDCVYFMYTSKNKNIKNMCKILQYLKNIYNI